MNKKLLLIFGAAILIILIILFIIVKTNSNIPSDANKNIEDFEYTDKKADDSKFIDEKLKNKLNSFPTCPTELSGIFTHELIDPDKIYMIPLGNLNPPGHTSPVDHIYFDTLETGKLAINAPTEGWIKNITEVSFADDNVNYVPEVYTLDIVICDGLEITLGNLTELIPEIKAEMDKQREDECKYEIIKPGHTRYEGQCYFGMNYKLNVGQLIGYTQKLENNSGLPFEIWAANYNVPPKAGVNWEYYLDDRYAHIMCLFDLYSGDLKAKYYSRFGRFNSSDSEPTFIPRTIPPICGEVNQDVVGTIQGMWYGEAPLKEGSLEFNGKGLAFVHHNIDPRIGEISIGGNFTDVGVMAFQPAHTGRINREFSQVTADNQIYCYYQDKIPEWPHVPGKILVQLIDDHNLIVEHQDGNCTGQESFIISYEYER